MGQRKLSIVQGYSHRLAEKIMKSQGEDEKRKDDKVDFQQKAVKTEECLKTMIDLSFRMPTFHAESSKALLKKRERGGEKSTAQAKEDNNRKEKGQKEEEHEEDEMNDEATSTMETD